MTIEPPKIASPCISICTMDAEDAICLGCHRTAEEIRDWKTMGQAQREQIWAQLAQRVPVPFGG